MEFLNISGGSENCYKYFGKKFGLPNKVQDLQT